MAAGRRRRRDHGRPGRRPDRHAGGERRLGRARLERRGGVVGGPARRPGGARADERPGPLRRRGGRAGRVGGGGGARPVPRRPPDPARRQHAAGARLGGVRRASLGRRFGPRGRAAPARARASRGRPGHGRRCPHARARRRARAAPRAPSTRATGRSPTRAPTWRPGPTSEAAADSRSRTLSRFRSRAVAGEVARALGAAAALGRPAAVIPDAETATDLEEIADGLRAAEADGVPVIVRCAPAFAAVLTGAGASAPAEPPNGEGGTLVVCGSFVPASTAQLDELARAHPDAVVTAHVAALAGAAWDDEVARVSAAARDRIARHGLAAVATDRERDPALVGPDAQQRVAWALAQVAARVRAGVVIAKGGITAAVTARRRPRRAGGPRGRPDPARRRAVAAASVGARVRGRPRQRGRPGAPGRRCARCAARGAGGGREVLTSFAELLASRREGTAVGAFTCYDLEAAGAALRAAADAGTGVILLIGGRSYIGPDGGLLLAALVAAARASDARALRPARSLRGPGGDRVGARGGRRRRDGRRVGAPVRAERGVRRARGRA